MSARIACFMIDRLDFTRSHGAQAGAIFKVDHGDGHEPDVYVVTPGGLARIGGKNSLWTLTGELPKVTARPSILISEYDFDGHKQPRWHGYLTDGFLEEIP